MNKTFRVPLKVSRDNKTYYTWIDEEDYARCCKIKWYLLKRMTFDPSAPFYVMGRVDGTMTYLHRYILHAVGGRVDHKDRDPLNNTKSNLRLSSFSTNNRNRLLRGGTSRFPGVSRMRSGKYIAQICVDGKRKYLGTHVMEKDAARAYRKAALLEDPDIYFDEWQEL